MASFDSIINVGERISDYCLTTSDKKGESFSKQTDATIRQWKTDDKSSGAAVSPWGRMTSDRNQLQAALSTIDAGVKVSVISTVEQIEGTFGYPPLTEVPIGYSGGAIELSAARDAAGTTLYLHTDYLTDVEDFPTAKPFETATRNEKPWGVPVSRIITEVFLSEHPPTFVVLIAGNMVVLVERESWPLGRFLAIDVALTAECNDTKTRGELSLMVTSLAYEHIGCATDGTTWWQKTIEESRGHVVKASRDLREAIKESIEIIDSDVPDRHHHQGFDVDNVNGSELSKQTLHYLYRILFLLFAEASPELNILPTGVPDYDEDYGLASLRDRILVEPPTDRAANGTYLYDSLNLLFDLINTGHGPGDQEGPLHNAHIEEGLTLRNLSADLFVSNAIAYVFRSKLSNAALHHVLQNFPLTRKTAGKERGYVSYATLGITQLGQVCEGLTSFTDSIAQEEMFEVAPKEDSSKDTWLVTPELGENLPTDSFVQKRLEDGTTRNRRYTPGGFVFRQSSRDREHSTSFYLPPVITGFVTGQAIEELRTVHRIDTANDIPTLGICEPAMGSDAFVMEAVNQLAEFYLNKKWEELGQKIEPERLAEELQKVKASIAPHRVYGVNLNKAAVELVEISLWLGTMSVKLKTPWFGLYLHHGNSLIGAQRSTFPSASLKKRDYLKQTLGHHSAESVSCAIESGQPDPSVANQVHRFLVPSAGWGAAADSKGLKEVAPEEVASMENWRKSIWRAFATPEIKQLKKLSERAERLWQLALVRLCVAKSQISQTVSVWGQEIAKSGQSVARKQMGRKPFGNMDGAYQRLRLVVDAWNTLWFWPLAEVSLLPSKDGWLSTLVDALGISTESTTKAGQYSIGYDLKWGELNPVEQLEFGTLPYSKLIETHPWLRTARQVSAGQAFFHWDLDFAAVMAEEGFGFQVGNPPWVRPYTDVDALYSEYDPWFNLAHKPTQTNKEARRRQLANDERVLATLARGLSDSVVTSTMLSDATHFPHLVGQQPDLYRGFMERTWANAAHGGIISLVHPESHFAEKKTAPPCAGAYRRLRGRWQFVNELVLFNVHGLVKYGIHIYSTKAEGPCFISAASLYRPKTVLDSLRHDGAGPLPGLEDGSGNWNPRPHRDRIITVDMDTPKLWRSIFEEPESPIINSRTVYTVNTDAAAVLKKLSAAPRVRKLRLQFSQGWGESIDKKKGYFDSS